MKRFTFSLLLCMSFTFSAFSQSPGDVSSNLQLWLRADQGTALTGTDVDSWTGQSPNTFTGASQGAVDAQYVAEGLNFNPVLRFNSSSFYNLGNPAVLDLQPNSDDMTIITMVVTTGTSTGTVISKAENNGVTRNYQVWFGGTDRVLHHTLGRDPSRDAVRWGTIYALNEPKITSGVVSSTLPDGVTASNPSNRLTPYVNGFEDPADRNDGTFTGGDSSLDVLVGARRDNGNSGSGYLYNGDIAEIIMYNRGLTAFERQKVESYLAIKYGVTLGSNDAYWDTPSNTSSPFGYAGTSNDYIASDNSILWDGSANAGYGYNIFGIARDDDSNLLQRKSKSVNVIPESILTMEAEAGALSTDLSYLLAGNDSDAVALTTSGLPERSTNILQRSWIARESANDAGMVTLEFDLSASSITDAEAANLELFIADNASFASYKNMAGAYNTTTDILTFTGVNFEDAEYFTLGTPEDYNDSYHIEFDGANDYMTTPLDLSGRSQLTMSAWFKRDNNLDSNQTGIIGQIGVMSVNFTGDNINVTYGGNVSGYGLAFGASSIGNDNASWHHVAATFNNGTIKVYFNGALVRTGVDGLGNTSLSTSTTTTFNIGGYASSAFSPKHFDGLIDEVRVFDVVLTDEQIQQMVYQEIIEDGGNVRGTVIPKDIEDTVTNANISWSNLEAYYPMTRIRGNCLLDETTNASNGRLYSLPTAAIQSQTAPMPYETDNNGAWTTENTWLHGDVWDIEDVASNKDWSIVHIHDNITTTSDHTHLGLIIDTNDRLRATTTQEIRNTWYLELNGTLDLREDAQLVQTEDSDLQVTSSGRLFRRQQGSNDMYRYNYWSSPVGIQNATSNNNDSRLNLLSDGSGAIQFTTALDPPLTSPATLSTRWLYTYQNGITYYDWSNETSATTISPGIGYIHKGPGTGGTEYEYIFEGKPNNGVITVPVTDTGGAGSVADVSRTQYLLGNPYPSAIDAHQFIDDNASVSGGTLYLWEQWSGSSHYLNQYEGGYAILSKTAKVRAYQFVGLSGADNGSQDGTKTPTQFLPVGQGFITEIVANGSIQFNNGQREFKEEASGESVFFDPIQGGDIPGDIPEQELNENLLQIIRLEFRMSNDLSRELVVAFGEETTDDFDYGYEARVNKYRDNDLVTTIGEDKMAIQAFSKLTDDKVVDLTLNSDGQYNYAIRLLDTEYIAPTQEIFIYDALEDTYTDIRNNTYEFTAIAGEDSERFKLVFQRESLSVDDYNGLSDVSIFVNQLENRLYVKGLQDDVKMLSIVNMLGQTVRTLQNVNTTTLESGISLSDLSSGVYIVTLEQNDNSKVTKKITRN